MKKINQLTVGDPVYIVREGMINYKQAIVVRVEKQLIEIDDYNGVYPRSDKNYSSRKDNYLMYCFANLPEAIRYNKLNGIKEVRRLIQAAKDSIDKVKKFRETNYENLNCHWLETTINKLENELK